ncbi:MAG: DinB family protein [Gemmatimonadaceae bacterium]
MAESFRAVRPAADEFAEFYKGYIQRVPDGDIVDTLRRQVDETVAFLREIPESKGDYRYGPDKWTIRQVIGHLSDTERVFSYRALRFSRGDTTPVPGFDENLYVDNAPSASCSLAGLIDEFEQVRRAALYLFGNLTEESIGRRGKANGVEVSVRALAFIAAGHETHHVQILKERYL